MIVNDEQTLRQKSENFQGSPHELQNLIGLLEEELENCENPGIGLAAIQVGVAVRVGILRTEKLNIDIVNGYISGGSKFIEVREGCLSFPNKFITVRRMDNIKFINGDGDVYELAGFEAQAIQHELDHMSGILMFDRSI